MTDLIVHPVILCGGAGTRLWPASRKTYPKQFSRLVGALSLYQSTLTRLSGPGFADPLILTGDPFRFIVAEQTCAIGRAARQILIEPEPKGTAPAVLAAALRLHQTDPDAVLLVAPSDQLIPEEEAFRTAIRNAVSDAAAGHMVIFGVTPDRAETGYGWIETSKGSDPQTPTLPVTRFIEKPDLQTAERLLAGGDHLWNAGLLLARADTIIAAYRGITPQMYDLVQEAMAGAIPDLGFLRPNPVPWTGLTDISVDYAILERAEGVRIAPLSTGWSDMGSWEAVLTASETDADGTFCSERATAIGCKGTLLRSESDGVELVGIGLEDIVVIAMSDAVLVAHRSETQRVRDAVATLKARGAKAATEFPRVHRPWGWFESLAVGDRFQVKRIVVHPGAALSLQSHHHRSEHWVVVQGTARVTVDETVRLVTENQSVYIPLGAVHRMENPGKLPMVLIEVQTGSYLGEDDIIRYEDIYQRSAAE
jgi:mannose-1-phosphate guanylyltransferase / mannose-6-phosphate isomerase